MFCGHVDHRQFKNMEEDDGYHIKGVLSAIAEMCGKTEFTSSGVSE